MSLENAKANLVEFAKELNLELVFDENNTCILGIDNTFSLHLTYEPNSDRLYLYSPILDGLPTDDKTRLALYEALLEGSMLGGQMAGGGVGVAVAEGLILMHCVIEMGIGADTAALRRFAPLFVECVEKWREKVKNIMEGKKTGPVTIGPAAGGGQRPGAAGMPRPASGGPDNSKFIKI